MQPLNTPLSQISRDFRLKPFKTMFIVGNGAVSGGTTPLADWLSTLDVAQDSPFYKSLSWQEKLAHVAIYFRLMRSLSADHRPRFDKLLESKEQLGRLYAAAVDSRQITRNRLPDHFERELCNPDTVIISLNWDTCILDELRFPNVIQLHGSCRHPRTIVLPTEYVLDFGKGKSADEYAWDVPKDQLDLLLSCHRAAFEIAEQVSSIYLWGASLSLYDAEVNSLLLAASAKKNVRRLIVIDPDLMPGKRAAAYLNRSEFTHVNPLVGFKKDLVSTIGRPADN